MTCESTPKTSDRGIFSARSAELLRATTLRIAIITTVLGCTASAIAGNSKDQAGKDGSDQLNAKATAQAANPLSTPRLSAATRLRQWFQTGQASWYGLRFQGHKTATGEKFDMNALTCAHRSLPLGTWLRVTNLRNRKSVLVRVNDRGPMVESRIIDLSYAAARAVGIGGTSKVKLEQVPANDPEVARVLIAQATPFIFPRLVPAR